ncbi:MAG: HAD-IIIC family phosphatase [Candidatus Eremiobacteraeota bacterium]|nr:HAD-IIIC family phosphatase [Candidatus Eremiobacteraeota bacterium]
MENEQRRAIKCLVWDLDNTLWDGILLEDREVFLKEEAVKIIKLLDGRGILNSIASRSDQGLIMEKLRELGIDGYFLFPQVHWGSKSSSLENIASLLNIGLDSLALIDDDPYERGEVAFSHPEVHIYSAEDLGELPDMDSMKPPFITDESSKRRLMYLAENARAAEERSFQGTPEEFLATLSMTLTLKEAVSDDLPRAAELVSRTHRLNTTGYAYSLEELESFCRSERHTLLIAGLEDRFGPCGKIGIALVEHRGELWLLKLLLTSCRVMARGIGTVLLSFLINETKKHGRTLQAEIIPTAMNRLMYVALRFSGFEEAGRRGDLVLLEHRAKGEHHYPYYMKMIVDGQMQLGSR